MGKREDHPKQAVYHDKKKTEVWEKDSAGRTTKEWHSTYHKESGNTTDHYGKVIKKK